MFGGPMAGPNPGVDMLPMSSPQVGQGMQQQSLNNGRKLGVTYLSHVYIDYQLKFVHTLSLMYNEC